MVDEQQIDRAIRELARQLPQFPDGRIDYAHSELALVVTCFVKFLDEILLLKRSAKVRTYRGKWSTVAGYLDEPKPLRHKVFQELQEELGVAESDVARLVLGVPFDFKDHRIHKTWRVHPVLAELKRRIAVKLDWEHTDFRWIPPADIGKFDTVPRLEESLARVLSL